MKKLFVIPAFLFTTASTYSQQKKDSTERGWHVSAMVRATSNGISNIPAFSLKKPALLVYLTIKNNRFTYEPQMAYSFSGTPWFMNNWFRYRIIQHNNFVLRTGATWTLSFQKYITPQNEITRVYPYLALEAASTCIFSGQSSLTLGYWYEHGFESGSLKTIHYLFLVEDLIIGLRKGFYIEALPQIFYLNLGTSGDGLFGSAIVGLKHKKIPLALSLQINDPLTTAFSPSPEFAWNVSLAWYINNR